VVIGVPKLCHAQAEVYMRAVIQMEVDEPLKEIEQIPSKMSG
jgi:hypothetical protein